MAENQRLIDPENFLKWVIKRFKCVPLVGSCDNDSESIKLLLAQAPMVDAAPVVHGHWIEHSHLEVGGECSVCGWQFQWFENAEARFCPHCGAKMDGGASS